jgi:hypothetical protein
MMISEVRIGKERDEMIKVSYQYNPFYLAKIKTIKGHKRHAEGKYWSFPNEIRNPPDFNEKRVVNLK